jgi:hypothetical protein
MNRKGHVAWAVLILTIRCIVGTSSKVSCNTTVVCYSKMEIFIKDSYLAALSGVEECTTALGTTKLRYLRQIIKSKMLRDNF